MHMVAPSLMFISGDLTPYYKELHFGYLRRCHTGRRQSKENNFLYCTFKFPRLQAKVSIDTFCSHHPDPDGGYNDQDLTGRLILYSMIHRGSYTSRTHESSFIFPSRLGPSRIQVSTRLSLGSSSGRLRDLRTSSTRSLTLLVHSLRSSTASFP